MFHTFKGPRYTKNEKYMKKRDSNNVFHVFLIFCVVESTKVCNMGTPWMRINILHPMSVSSRNFSKPIGK